MEARVTKMNGAMCVKTLPESEAVLPKKKHRLMLTFFSGLTRHHPCQYLHVSIPALNDFLMKKVTGE